MPVQKILPIARKMGEENFLAYKQYIKKAKTLKSGEAVQAVLNLKNVTIVDAIGITAKSGTRVDIEGVKNLLREIHKKYFPRAADKDTTKTVTMSYTKKNKDVSNTNVEILTNDKNSEEVGHSFYKFARKGKAFFVDLQKKCEDFGLKLQANVNLKNADIKTRQNLNINLNPHRDLRVNENGEQVLFSLNATPNEDVSLFNVSAEISKQKLESMFGGELERNLPELITKSGIKF